MLDYIFTLKYRLPFDASPDALVERLGEAGLTDALAGIGIAGRLGLEFTRAASSGTAALESAAADVSLCLPEAVLIEACPDYAGLTDIAEHVGLSRQAVRKIMAADKDFPAPVHDGSTGLWHLSEVLDWFMRSRQQDVDPALCEVAWAARALNAGIESAKILGLGHAAASVPARASLDVTSPPENHGLLRGRKDRRLA